MPTVTSHALGTFNWPELATKDQDGAKKFYTGLFGWEFKDQDMGPQGVYTIFTLHGSDVAALYTLDANQAAAGVPPYWGTYITVENADAAAAKAKTLGGTVIMEPFDVMEHGRMAVITDPQGATFCVWQAKKHCGIQVFGEPNSLGWTQLNATDTGVAKKFYTELIGWKTQDMPASTGGEYTMWLKADGPAGGMMAMPPQAAGAPSHWLPYFAVTNVDEAAKKGASLGAATYVPPTDIPNVGRFAVLADPQGAAFAVVTFLQR